MMATTPLCADCGDIRPHPQAHCIRLLKRKITQARAETIGECIDELEKRTTSDLVIEYLKLLRGDDPSTITGHRSTFAEKMEAKVESLTKRVEIMHAGLIDISEMERKDWPYYCNLAERALEAQREVVLASRRAAADCELCGDGHHLGSCPHVPRLPASA